MHKNDYGTKESKRHGKYIIEGVGKAQRARNLKTSIIGYYHNQDVITLRHKIAAEKLMSLYKGIGSRRSTALGAIMPSQASSSHEMSDRQAECEVRFKEAMRTCRTRTHESVVYNVCIEDYSLKAIVDRYEYYKTSQNLMPILKEGLDDIAEYFGIRHKQK